MISKLHNDVIAYIKKTYPLLYLECEYVLPKTRLRLDIYIKELNIGIEIQGVQHYSYSNFFYKNSENFLDSIKRDKNKNTFCFLNEIDIIYIKYDSKEKYWKNKIDNIINEKINTVNTNKTKVFFNLSKYKKKDIEFLLCPICKTILNFNKDPSLNFYNAKCCRKIFTLSLADNDYLGEVKNDSK